MGPAQPTAINRCCQCNEVPCPDPVFAAHEIAIVETVAAMAATTPWPELKYFDVLGRFVPGDSAGGRWLYLPDSVAVVDGYDVVATPLGTGRYIRLF